MGRRQRDMHMAGETERNEGEIRDNTNIRGKRGGNIVKKILRINNLHYAALNTWDVMTM
jgi:hypothetical protein